MDERIITLETRVAYQDKMIDELNEVVTLLRDTVDVLQRKVTHLETVITDLQDERQKGVNDERPPHY